MKLLNIEFIIQFILMNIIIQGSVRTKGLLFAPFKTFFENLMILQTKKID